ncbi:hypothetical protein NFI96_027632 [Prochilodus magdalenae]|nr:hypothetical protein NFI96_027632 [Prochilodus magdalenae]
MTWFLILYELPTSSQWCFDIQWCPKNPALLSAASFDGRISIYSIMGGNNDVVNSAADDQLSSSFGNMDPFGTGQTLPPLQLSQPTTTNSIFTPLKKPPRWIRRPVGASFAFGGKLVSWENIKPPPQQPQQPVPHVVHISQVVTETDFLDRSNQLQSTLTAGTFVEFCQTKFEAAQNEFEKTVWAFLKVHFEDDPRGKYLELLGYKKEELALKIASALEGKDKKSDEDSEEEMNGTVVEEETPAAEESPELEEIPVVEEDHVADPNPVLEETPFQSSETVNVKARHDVDRLITEALLIGDFEAAVSLCLHDNRMADSIILAIAGGPELLEKTQKKYMARTQSKIGKLISAVVMKDWIDVLETCDLQNWKEALAAVMTYAKPAEFSFLCGLLGTRLEAAEDLTLQAQACLCYICAGSVEQLVFCWSKAQDSSSPLMLQDLVEKVIVLRQAVERAKGGATPAVGVLLAEKMSQYAGLLASQGSLQTAVSYLPTSTEQATSLQVVSPGMASVFCSYLDSWVAVQLLRERLSRALGQHASSPPTPSAPAATTAPLQNRRPSVPADIPAQAYTLVQPQAQQLPPQPTPTVPQQQYFQQGRAASTVTSWSNQTPTLLPSVPRPLALPADLQAEPVSGQFGLQSPVSAFPAGPFVYSQQYQTFPQVQQFTPPSGGPAIYQPAQYSSSTSLPSPSSSSAPAPFYPSQFMHPSSQPAPPVFSAPSLASGQLAPSAPRPRASSSSLSPTAFSSEVSFQLGGPGSPSAYLPPPPTGASGTQVDPALIPASQRTGPQNGWNDPPALSRVPKKKKVPDNYIPPAPITAPIMASLGDQQQATPMQHPQHLQQPQLLDQSAGVPTPFNPAQQQPLGPAVRNPPNSNMTAEGAPGAPTGDVVQPMQTAEKIMKKPIPDEHLILKTTFEGLIQKCLAAATDPQTKRKLDDANKRLESLYDKLREQTLSPAIVGGLHNMARSIESCSYADGLNIHTHIVSNSNFSETSAFMPVLKVVLTQANKLGV